MKTLYLAGPRGFSELNKPGTEHIEAILSKKFHVINPFEKAKALGQRIGILQDSLEDLESSVAFSHVKQDLRLINRQIGEQNADLLRSADIVVAILDGADVDSGTAAEIGFAYGLGVIIYGLRGDMRWSGDNLGCRINLQVEYFINASGGRVLFSLADLQTWVDLQ